MITLVMHKITLIDGAFKCIPSPVHVSMTLTMSNNCSKERHGYFNMNSCVSDFIREKYDSMCCKFKMKSAHTVTAMSGDKP